MARNLFTAFETQDDIPHEDLASDTSSESDSDSQSQDLDPAMSGQSSTGFVQAMEFWKNYGI